MDLKNRVSLYLGMRRGQTMAEYALILATIAAITVALIQTAGTYLLGLLAKVSALL
jgi:Flp pilus assembly pilin Flp